MQQEPCRRDRSEEENEEKEGSWQKSERKLKGNTQKGKMMDWQRWKKVYRWVGLQLLNKKSPVVKVVVHSEVARLIDVAQQPRLTVHVTHSVRLYKYTSKKRAWNKRLMTLLTAHCSSTHTHMSRNTRRQIDTHRQMWISLDNRK